MSEREGAGPGRRQVLGGLAALGAGLVAATPLSRAQTVPPQAERRRIDVHHHISPPGYIALLKDKNLLSPPMVGITPEKAIADMDKGGVATAIGSIPGPGVWFGDKDQARKLARECNEYAAKLVQDHPGRFGMWATLPAPDIDGSLAEIAYALDTLKADGIQMWTSYGDKWLGDPMLQPIFAELNRRRAVVYTHPMAPNCCGHLEPGVPAPLIEFGTDTTRAIARMVFSGTAAKTHDMSIIFSHGGGTMPFLIERFLFQAKLPQSAPSVPNGVLDELRRFYYGIAQSVQVAPMQALRDVVPVSQIVYGTDFPYRSAAEYPAALRAIRVFNAPERWAIERDNVARLLPRYRA